MSKRLVGLCHLVGILTLFASVAVAVDGVHDLAGQTLTHGALAAGTGISGEPCLLYTSRCV